MNVQKFTQAIVTEVQQGLRDAKDDGIKIGPPEFIEMEFYVDGDEVVTYNTQNRIFLKIPFVFLP